MINKIINLFLRYRDPIKYAKRIGVKIGTSCRLNDNPNWGSEPYIISIGDHSEISFGCTFITHDGATWTFRDEEKYKDVIKFGSIQIGNNCFIGANTTLLPGTKIGDNCIIGACSLVNSVIPDGEVWAGIPAKRITTTHDYAEKCLNNTPSYDKENYIRNKKDEVQRIVGFK